MFSFPFHTLMVIGPAPGHWPEISQNINAGYHRLIHIQAEFSNEGAVNCLSKVKFKSLQGLSKPKLNSYQLVSSSFYRSVLENLTDARIEKAQPYNQARCVGPWP